MSVVSVRWRGGWCVGWGTAVQTRSESCMSTQSLVEPAASVVDASAVWHGNASVPRGRFWLHCSAHAATSGCCWLARVEYRVAIVQSRHDQTAGQWFSSFFICKFVFVFFLSPLTLCMYSVYDWYNKSIRLSSIMSPGADRLSLKRTQSEISHMARAEDDSTINIVLCISISIIIIIWPASTKP